MKSKEDFGAWFEDEFHRLTAEGMSPQEAMPRALEHAKALAVKKIAEATSNPPAVSPEALEMAKREAERSLQAAQAPGADQAVRSAAQASLERYSSLSASAAIRADLDWREAHFAADALLLRILELGTPAEHFRSFTNESSRFASAKRKEVEDLARAAASAGAEAMKALEARGRAIEEEMKEFQAGQQKRQEERENEIKRLTEEARLASELAGERAKAARMASRITLELFEKWKSLQPPSRS